MKLGILILKLLQGQTDILALEESPMVKTFIIKFLTIN